MAYTPDPTDQIVAQALQQAEDTLARQREFEARLLAMGLDLRWAEAMVANVPPAAREQAQAMLSERGIPANLIAEVAQASSSYLPRVLRERLKAHI